MTPTVFEHSQSKSEHLLETMGWRALSVDGEGGFLIEEFLEERLRAINQFEYDGQQHRFDNEAIRIAVKTLTTTGEGTTGHDNERVWRLLRFGTSLEQSFAGHPRSFAARYIDWEDPSNNVYHFVSDLRMTDTTAGKGYQPDITLFVNGIPFVVIECKEPSASVSEPNGLRDAIAQLLHAQTQRPGSRLFRYVQLLIVLNDTHAEYGTVGSSPESWQRWTDLEEDARNIPEPNRLLQALCRPARLLDFASTFTSFDAGMRRIARPHQFFAVQDILARINKRSENGRRQGGLVWQAASTGKSMTMMMTAVAILKNIKDSNIRVVLLSDRAGLEAQLHRTFSGSGIECWQATTGRELLDLLRNSQIRVISTLIQKFDAAVRSQATEIDNPNIFVLIDEAERSQLGQFGASMRQILPSACFIAFTGTPTLRAVNWFGSLITRPYSTEEAVRDGVLLPLYYEGRKVGGRLGLIEESGLRDWDPDQDPEHAAPGYTTFASFLESEEYIRATATDISQHFSAHFGNTPFKGILIAGSQYAAVAYKRHLDQFGLVTSEVLISLDTFNRQRGPDPLQEFYWGTIRKFSSAQRYEDDVLQRFTNTASPQILICVARFAGLDVPQCAVMYLTRPLSQSGLVQAMSRATRPWGPKERGLLVDYWDQHRKIAAALDPDLSSSGDSQSDVSMPLRGGHRQLRRVADLDLQTQMEIALPDPAGPQPEDRAQAGYEQVLTHGLQATGIELPAAQIKGLSKQIHAAVLGKRKVNWTRSPDARNRMLTAIEDELFAVQSARGRPLDVAIIDLILSGCLEVAMRELP